MLSSLRTLFAISAALLGIGCATENVNAPPTSSNTSSNAPPKQTGPSTLDACGLARPCSWPVSAGKPEEADDIRCVVSELSAGRSLSIDTLLVADGPSSRCEVHQELHFFADTKTAYDVWRKKCGANEERVVRRCTMLTNDAYATCLASFDASRGKPEGITCSTPTEWMGGCTDVADVACP